MRIRAAHVSMQFDDNNEQHTHDIEKLFKRAVDRRLAWITGTEGGPGTGNIPTELVRIACLNDYKPWIPVIHANGVAQHTDSWIVVRNDLINGDFTAGFELAIPGSKQLEKTNPGLPKKHFGPRGLVHVSFNTTPPGLGRVSIGAAHYLTDGRTPDSPWYKWNQRIADEIAAWAEREGEGPALVFYGGDQNDPDRTSDTFRGGPLTSVSDELRKWENTGHGSIDTIATYNKDKRVSALKVDALNDKEFFLHTDHFYLEALINVEPLKR